MGGREGGGARALAPAATHPPTPLSHCPPLAPPPTAPPSPTHTHTPLQSKEYLRAHAKAHAPELLLALKALSASGGGGAKAAARAG